MTSPVCAFAMELQAKMAVMMTKKKRASFLISFVVRHQRF